MAALLIGKGIRGGVAEIALHVLSVQKVPVAEGGWNSLEHLTISTCSLPTLSLWSWTYSYTHTHTHTHTS